jgi:hypothetical protein
MAKKIVVEFEAKGLEGVSKTVGDVVEETKSLKQQFREAAIEAQTLAGSKIVDQKALDDAIARTAELKDRMNDVNEQVGVLTAGSKFEKMSNNLGDIGGKIASLDFEGANESASRLLSFSKSITFGDATKGIKDLGSTFLQLGKALLTNPLFLIAAVIAAVVVAVVKLLDKIGVLKVIMNALGKVFEFVMIPINAIIDGLKALSDWLGITNNAAEDAAEKQAQSAEKMAEAYEDKSARVVEGYDHEIRMAEINGESTREAELKKAYFILNTAKQRAKADIARLQSAKLAGDLDEAEIKDLEKKARASVDAATAASNDITEMKAEFRAEDKEKREKDAQEEKEAEEDKAKEAADRAKKASEDAKKRREEEKRARLDAERTIIDLTLANMQEGVEKEIAINDEKFKRLLEQNAANSLITAQQRKAIEDQLLYQQTTENIKITDDNYKTKLDKELAFQSELKAIRADINATEKELLAIQYEDDVAALDKKLKDEQYTLEQYNLYKAQLDLNYKNNKEIIDNKYAARELAAKLELDARDYDGKLAKLENDKLIELSNTDLTGSEKLLIEQKYSDAKLKLIEDEKKARQEEIQAGLNGASQGLTAIQGLSDAIFANKMQKLEKGSVEEEKAARKQFNINKKLQIAQAVIQGIQATMAAYSSGSAIPVVGAVTGPAFAALAAITSLANINKIKNSTFQGGTASTAGAGGGSSAGGEVSSPQFNSNALFSTGGGSTQGITSGSQSQNVATPVIKAVVVESDITNTQQRMSNIRQQATI